GMTWCSWCNMNIKICECCSENDRIWFEESDYCESSMLKLYCYCGAIVGWVILNNIEAVTENNEIINLVVKLIWNATEKSVSSVIFNRETATVLSQDRSRSIVVDLNETDSVIIKGETYRKLIEEGLQVEKLDELMHDVQTNENNTLNLNQEVTNRAEKLSDDTVAKTTQPINKIFKSSKRTENDQNTPKYRDKVDNYEPENNEELESNEGSMTSDLNIVSTMLEQTNLEKNVTYAKDIDFTQDNDNHEEDLDISDDDSPGWSECEDCYGNKKELCEYCGCSVCKWKGDRGHILLCDGPCNKNFHTRCLKPPLTRIPTGNWYCKDCESENSNKSKRKIRQSTKKNKRLKSNSDKKYKTQKDTAKKKTANCSKKRKTFSNLLEKSTPHNDSSINNRVKGANFPTVVVEVDERFSSRQQTNKTENVPATHSDIQQLKEKIPATQSDIQVMNEGLVEKDNISNEYTRKNNLIVTEHEQIPTNESNSELVNDDSSVDISDDNWETDSQSSLLNTESSQDNTKEYFDIQIEGKPKPILVVDEPIDKIFEKIQKEFEASLLTVDNVNNDFEEEVDIGCQIRNIFRKISDSETNYNYSRVKYLYSLCKLASISYELTKKVKELKKDNKFSVSRFINEIDQETGKWKKNPNANEWNSLFVKGETVKARVYKIILAEALGISKNLRIRDEMIAARRLFLLVARLGWNVISKSKKIDPNRLKAIPKANWEELINNIKAKYQSDDNDYKYTEKSLKELEDNF
ncbi:16316_t:CDS:10, partial [Gigaspora margarita]